VTSAAPETGSLTAPEAGPAPAGKDPVPVLAVIGGGQLARMMAQAAVGLGVPLRLLAEGPDVSAAQVIPDAVVGDYRDLETLRKVADGCAVVTFDHEHVPPEHLRTLDDEGHACRPGPDALVHAQDKGTMRSRLAAMGVPCPRNRLVADPAEVAGFAAEVGGFPVVLKTTRGGYDGKGVWVVADAQECAEPFAVAADTGVQILAEERVDFRRELSALVARSPSGQVAAYPVVESVQRDGICWEVLAPAPGLDPDLAVEAQQIAMQVAGELGVTGILAVELFETADGRVLVNELAMRPHNTGHWSIDGAVTSQFENHLRAVLDLPLGSPATRAPCSVMVNILGGPDARLSGRLYDGYRHVFARDPRLKVHLYGKSVKPGRKVGHVTAYGDDLDDVRERAQHAAAWFRGDLGMESE
jgi:5-(carboxyamino)imidazole ribonucleotide synthase